MRASGINGLHYAATVQNAWLNSISLAAHRICITRVPVSCEPSRSASLDRVTRYLAVSSSSVRRGRIPICSRARPRPSNLGRQRNVMTSISAVRCSASSRTVIFDAFMCARMMAARNTRPAVSKQSGEFSRSGAIENFDPSEGRRDADRSNVINSSQICCHLVPRCIAGIATFYATQNDTKNLDFRCHSDLRDRATCLQQEDRTPANRCNSICGIGPAQGRGYSHKRRRSDVPISALLEMDGRLQSATARRQDQLPIDWLRRWDSANLRRNG